MSSPIVVILFLAVFTEEFKKMVFPEEAVNERPAVDVMNVGP
jgi:hypothetical protein